MLVSIALMYWRQQFMVKKSNAERDDALKLLVSRIAAIEASKDGVYIVNSEGDIAFMNSSLMELHGIDEVEKKNFLGQPWVDLYSENGRLEIQDYILPELLENKYWRGRSELSKVDGQHISVELSLTLLADGGIIGTTRDMSEHQKMGKEKETLENQLFQAQKMEAIGRLAGGIAHDFNNILAAMNGYAEFLVEDLNGMSQQKEFANNILQAGRQAKSLVDQMLAFSRQKQSNRDVLDVMEPMEETLAMLRASLPKTIELQTDFAEGHGLIEGNSTQISQVIMNLCVNAKDAMDDEHGSLFLGMYEETIEPSMYSESFLTSELPNPEDTPYMHFEERDSTTTRLYLGKVVRGEKYIKIVVKDAGTGMSRVIMENIFEPFFTTKPVDKGTGLGLSTVHGVVVSHKGALILESALGEGTSFTLYFPVSEAVSVEKTLQTTVQEDLQAGKILLVEDQDNVREMLTQMLLRMGLDVDVCCSGVEALAVLKDCSGYYDLVISDHNMPKMTGLELVQQVSMEDETLPFLLVSGYSLEKMRKLLSEHEAVKAILRKPVSRDDLAREIKEVLAHKKQQAA